jgi:hypothetical protein
MARHVSIKIRTEQIGIRATAALIQRIATGGEPRLAPLGEDGVGDAVWSESKGPPTSDCFEVAFSVCGLSPFRHEAPANRSFGVLENETCGECDRGDQ